MESLEELLRKLEADCETLASTIVHQRFATADELAPHRPGGGENADDGPAGWLRYYAKLHRIHAVRAEAPATSPVLVADAMARDRLKLSALNEEPIAIATSVGERRVFPKSKWALDAMAECERRIGYLSERRDAIEAEGPSGLTLDLVKRIDIEMGYQLALIVWVATTEGPGLPFEPFTAMTPAVPAEVMELSPLDCLAIQRAFVECNLLRLLALREQTKAPKPGESVPMWSGFYAGRAHATGIPARTLYRDRSLPGLVAESAITGEEQEKARDEAERQHRATRPEARSGPTGR